jgi:hypothetical protein
MTLLLDVLFIRRPLTPTEFYAALIVWLLVLAIVCTYVFQRWLTHADLEQVDDDDLDCLIVDRGELR